MMVGKVKQRLLVGSDGRRTTCVPANVDCPASAERRQAAMAGEKHTLAYSTSEGRMQGFDSQMVVDDSVGLDGRSGIRERQAVGVDLVDTGNGERVWTVAVVEACGRQPRSSSAVDSLSDALSAGCETKRVGRGPWEPRGMQCFVFHPFAACRDKAEGMCCRAECACRQRRGVERKEDAGTNVAGGSRQGQTWVGCKAETGRKAWSGSWVGVVVVGRCEW